MQRHHFADRGPYCQNYAFSSNHIRMWELVHKESRALKNWCFRCGTGEDSCKSLGLQGDPTRKSTLDIHWKDCCWSWHSNTLATWWKEPTHWKRALCWERLRAKGKGDSRGWVVGWHHRFNGREFEQTSGGSEGQESLVCYHPWGHKELDTV